MPTDREICQECFRPKATEQDYEDIPEGEGGHLCWKAWDEDECRYAIATGAAVGPSQRIAELEAEVERLRNKNAVLQAELADAEATIARLQDHIMNPG